MIRTALFAALLAIGPGTAFAQSSGVESVGLIGFAPWASAHASAAFGPDDAYLFEDVSDSSQLAPEALVIAERIDRDRLAAGAGDAPVDAEGRVGEAFGGFVRYGRDGLAYATLDVARAAAEPTRFAQGPIEGPSRVALNLSLGD
ncbi:hypothetical protein [Chenggangzhangella methanolivorans]|uniref:MipA/OmpV family protein n=1 Tax=Chenggangzhangella methanolivorans TaxID=1437009 RepID=A0A9E6UPB0_9HYPH|nr:hypothetical protein [Chenggangzhangella methanolivorans]QZO01219.1 hypothetical protein K6K41_06680 [Chenggangzhangella methanolivorans]